MKLKTISKTNEAFPAAGSTWIVPKVTYVILPDGKWGLQKSEINRIHRAVANHLCGKSTIMSGRELEFLCSITQTSLSKVAERFQVNKSTVSRWKHHSNGVPLAVGNALKRWFWFKIFGAEVADRQVSMLILRDDSEFLDFARKQAITQKLTTEVHQEAA